MYVIGVDPGKRGGVAVVGSPGVLLASPLPLRTIEDGRTILDGPELIELIAFVIPIGETDVKVVLENAWGRPTDGSKGSFTFGGHFWVAEDRLREQWPDNLEIINAKTWQKALLPGCRRNRGETKAAAIGFCKDRWPGVSLTPPRCRGPHDGVADALCIATYGFDGESPVPRRKSQRKTRGHRS